jgi:linoleoyl-CoA desaturase
MKNSWLNHQFATTNDVKINNWFTRNVLGNFNFHIAHQLFPNISSVYAPEVTKVIKDYADDNGLGYRSYPIKKALLLHYRLIRYNAVGINFLEEEM